MQVALIIFIKLTKLVVLKMDSTIYEYKTIMTKFEFLAISFISKMTGSKSTIADTIKCAHPTISTKNS
jgi:hypothetical protein